MGALNSLPSDISQLDISVCICTWNRARTLDRTLHSIRRLRVREGLRWEVIVIDNGSTDATQRVLGQHLPALPLRVLAEPRPGVAWARMLGLAEARGRLIAWTDDDIEVDPGWLETYVDASVTYPESAFWGGCIEVQFEEQPPKWIARAWPVVASVYGEHKLSNLPIEIRHRNQYPFGANYAARAEVHRRYPFDLKLGRRCRDRYLGGEETAAFQAMLRDGHKGWWLPDARVIHWIPPQGATLKHIGRYWRGAGENAARQNSSSAGILGLRLRALAVRGRYHLERLSRPPEVWARTFLRAEYFRGRVSSESLRRDLDRDDCRETHCNRNVR